MRLYREKLIQVNKEEIVSVAQKYLRDQTNQSSQVIFGPENPGNELHEWSILNPINSF
jgi:Zn-dependent M16 (insulinase) family peptidase